MARKNLYVKTRGNKYKFYGIVTSRNAVINRQYYFNEKQFMKLRDKLRKEQVR